MKRSPFIIMLISAVTLFAAACNDNNNNDGPDNSLSKAVVGTYPITYTVDEGEYIESYAVVTRTEGAEISAILTMYERQQSIAEVPSSNKIFSIGLPLEQAANGIAFRNPMLNAQGKEDGLPYKTTVVIDGVTYEEAAVRINGTFLNSDGLGDPGTGPNRFIEFTAKISPAKTVEEPDPADIQIWVTDSRLFVTHID